MAILLSPKSKSSIQYEIFHADEYFNWAERNKDENVTSLPSRPLL